MQIFIETDRFIVREILPTDVDAFFELDSDPEVHQYLGQKPCTTIEESAAMIGYIRQQYVDYGIGRWAIVDKNTNAFIGWTGLKYITEPTNGRVNYYDIGYRLIKRYWGQGIATETAQAVLQYTFEKLQLDMVCAITDCNNAGSNAILTKIGLAKTEVFDYEGTPHNWYQIAKSDFA